MSYSVWGALAETHWWIYLLFAWIAFLSFQATKPRKINMRISIFYPISFILMLLILLPIVIKITLYKFSLLLLAIIPGAILGYLQFRTQRIKAIKQSSEFYVPGSWLSLIFLFVLLVIKFYYYNYPITPNFNILYHENTSSIIAIFCGFFTGLLSIRSYCLYRCMKSGPYGE